MHRAEHVAARILFWGGLLSVVIMTAGLVATGMGARAGLGLELDGLRADHHRPGPAGETVTSLHQVVGGLTRRPVEPAAVSALGILSLLVTPIVAVAATIPAFIVEGDRRYAAIAALVLAALTASLWLGGG